VATHFLQAEPVDNNLKHANSRSFKKFRKEKEVNFKHAEARNARKLREQLKRDLDYLSQFEALI